MQITTITRPLTAALTLLLSATAIAGPQIQRWTAPNGAQVQFVESTALPLIDIQVAFPAGTAFDPADNAGVASLTRSMLDAGSEGLDEQQIAERIADTGARIGGGADMDLASLSVRTLSSATERDAAIDLAATLLARPTFPAEILERERERSITQLRDALTRPDTLAARSFMAAIYGEHPYGRAPTVESLQGITREEVVDFHRRHYLANTAVVTIVGDVDRAGADAIAQRLTRDLPAGEAPAPLTRPAMPNSHVERLAHPSAQSHLIVGLPGMSRDDPDYFPLLVGNYVLGGGGFVSRLTKEVREKRGFAYSVSSYFMPQRVAGPFQIGLQTKGSQADEALRVVRAVLDEFVAKGPTPAELKGAQDNLINGFGLRLDSNRKTLDYVAMLGFYGLAADWLDSYPKEVAAVTAEAVRDAFARRVRPEHLVTVVVGGDGDGANGAPTASPAGAAPAEHGR